MRVVGSGYIRLTNLNIYYFHTRISRLILFKMGVYNRTSRVGRDFFKVAHSWTDFFFWVETALSSSSRKKNFFFSLIASFLNRSILLRKCVGLYYASLSHSLSSFLQFIVWREQQHVSNSEFDNPHIFYLFFFFPFLLTRPYHYTGQTI